MKAEIKSVELPITTRVERVVLTMSKDEAQFLQDITCSIGGSPDTTRRSIADGLGRSLAEIGITRHYSTGANDDFSGSIYFEDVSK